MLVSGVPTWQPQGPAPISQAAAPINPNVGAVQDVVVDPDRPDTIYLATVNGGVWKTTNGTNSSPNCTPLTTAALAVDVRDHHRSAKGLRRLDAANSLRGNRERQQCRQPGPPRRDHRGGRLAENPERRHDLGPRRREPACRTQHFGIYANGKFLVVATEDHFGKDGDLFFTDDALNADPGKIGSKRSRRTRRGPLSTSTRPRIVSVPGTPSLVYAGVVGSGVLRSTDSGKTWSLVTRESTRSSTFSTGIKTGM